MTQKRFGSIAAAALALVLGACATRPDTNAPICSSAPRVVDADGELPMNGVGIVDSALGKRGLFSGGGRIAIAATDSHRNPTGTLEAWTTVRNCTAKPMQLEARAQFFDAEQYPVEAPTAWTRLFLSQNGVVGYKANSSSDSEVTYYYLEIREAR
jgi:hypothetical protein